MPNSPVPFVGPYYGLNTRDQPRNLGPQWCVDARNVLLSEGRIQPAWPLTPWQALDVTATTPGTPMSIYAWESPAAGVVVLYKSIEGLLIAVKPDGSWVELAQMIRARPASFVPVHDRLFVMDGGEHVYTTDGTADGTYRAGIPAPLVSDDNFEPVDALDDDPYLAIGWYEWAISYYDEDRDVESNVSDASIARAINEVEGEKRMRIAVPDAPGEYRATHVRLYRRSVTVTLNTVTSRGPLVLQSMFRIPRQYIYDPIGTRTAHNVLGDAVIGPFGPTKNGVPKFASLGHWYKDRLFLNDTSGRDYAHTDILRYSALGRPDHVDPDDNEPLQGDAEQGITGMGVVGGQLVIGKPVSIWVLSGSILAHTNATVATGATLPASSHQLYKTNASVGCANKGGGNGIVVVGRKPGLAVFNSATGFFGFDGVDANPLSDEIEPTWRKFARHGGRVSEEREKHQEVTYAHDVLHQVLYIANGYQEPGDPQVLVFHYGRRHRLGAAAGVWSYLALDDLASIRCVGTAVGVHEFPGEAGSAGADYYGAFVAGVRGLAGVATKIFVASQVERVDQVALRWRYETPPLRPREAGLAHVYELRWLHDRVTNASQPVFVEFGFRDTRDGPYKLSRRSVTNGIYTYQPVQREPAELSLLIQTPAGDSPVWHEFLGVSGWILEFEPTGDR
jgi:hypothetical protein